MDTISAGLFPISFNAHIIFTIVAVLFFVMQFIRQRQLYQILTAIAVPIPLILYKYTSITVFYSVGIIELILIVAIGIMLFSTGKKDDNKKKSTKKKESANDEA
jgi:glycerol-3-phosphate acyltransferase PlsY